MNINSNINNFKEISKKFKEIDNKLNRELHIYLIGGIVLLYNNLKESTKDIDIVLKNKEDRSLITKILKKDNFSLKKADKTYKNMNLENILTKKNYRFDLFNKVVCGKLFLSKNMIKRSKLFKKYNYLSVFLCSLEDIFVFKSITEREGDLQDCISISLTGLLDWYLILNEIKYQIKKTENLIWVTWFEERMNLLIDNDINIPIIKDIRKLSYKYYTNLGKDLNK